MYATRTSEKIFPIKKVNPVKVKLIPFRKSADLLSAQAL